MRAVTLAMLENMPDPSDLHVERHGGRCWVMVGSAVLAEYAEADTVIRNFAVTSARRAGFAGKRVAEVFGLSAAYVATLHAAALREGSAALVKNPGRGRPAVLAGEDLDRAREWRAAGVSDREIGRRLGTAGTTVGRQLGPRLEEPGEPVPQPAAECEPLFSEDDEPVPAPASSSSSSPPPPPPAAAAAAGQAAAGGGDGVGRGADSPPEPPPHDAVPGGTGGGGLVPTAGGGIAGGRVRSRYAGVMLLYPFAARAGAGQILETAAGGDRDRARLLAAVTACFGLGAATTEAFKHLAAAEAGPVAGMRALPDLRTLRPALAGIADAADPLELQAMLATAMLAADPVVSGVYYVDDHFVPYTGAKPVGKGWNNKRGRAERGRADTHVTTADGRAVCFVTGEPSGLSSTLPKALAELKKTVPPGTPVMLGFDRGGAYPAVFTHCRDNGVHWITYRRAPLAVPEMLPVISTVTVSGKPRTIAWTDEKTQLKDYGEARQITLFEHGRPVLQILTSDFGACPADLLGWLKSRWREENFLKYASANYGIDKICDYFADIEANTKMQDNPARKNANTQVREAEKNLAAAERDLAVLLADPAITPAAKNTRLIPAAERKITAARRKLAAAKKARDTIPVKLPANQISPGAQTAVLRAGRRGLQMVLRLLAHNAEHWLATSLNAYLRDDDEYRAITRETIIRGLAGIIDFTPAAITVTLQAPGSPRIARVLAHLIDEINHLTDPPVIPGDNRPITYRITPRPVI
jgi:transposase